MLVLRNFFQIAVKTGEALDASTPLAPRPSVLQKEPSTSSVRMPAVRKFTFKLSMTARAALFMRVRSLSSCRSFTRADVGKTPVPSERVCIVKRNAHDTSRHCAFAVRSLSVVWVMRRCASKVSCLPC